MRLVALNCAKHDAVFDAVRACGAEVVHEEYRSSWEEVSARRTGGASPPPTPVSDALRAALATAEIVFGFVVPRDLLSLAPRLRWLATPATGIDHLRGTGILESGVTVTTTGGLFAWVIAEHVLASMLFFAKRTAQFEALQRERTWRPGRVLPLRGRTVGLVGVGSIGSEVAVRAKAFGMEVLGVGRRDPAGRRVAGVDRLLPRAALGELLGASDYVVVAVADTAETRGMIGAEALAAMRPDAVLVNVARGTIVDENALVAALRAGRLGGAALDVFAREPLPAESPLWELPNVLVTPHNAVNVEEYLPESIRHLAENVRRFVVREPLENRWDPARGY